LQPGSDSRQWRLRVSDNGVGLPDDFEIRRSQRLGLQLVSDLAKQLGGTLEIGPAPAAAFTITFSPVASTEAVPAQDATGR
jgi:two-component sensor histidine kinase